MNTAAPLLSVFLNTCGCRGVTARCVCMHACVPLRVSKNEEEERWERWVKCVCVCVEEEGWGGARLNSVTSVHYN